MQGSLSLGLDGLKHNFISRNGCNLVMQSLQILWVGEVLAVRISQLNDLEEGLQHLV